MAASGRPEDTEILFRHIELITAKMELLHTLFGPGSEYVKCFDTSEGKTWAKYATNYTQALTSGTPLPSPPSGNSMKQWLLTQYPKSQMIFHTIKYICQWSSMTLYQIEMSIQKINELDIRWNQHNTLSLCSLFVQLVKTIIYIGRNQFLVNYALMVPVAPNEETAGTNKKEFSKYIEFINSCYSAPFEYVSKKLQSIKVKMARLASITGTLIAKLFGTFPLIEWEPFSVFTKRTSPPDSTLPADEFIILQNIMLFKETIFFFLFVFPDTTKSNECFSLIIEALLSESPFIPITRTIRIPLTEFLAIAPNDIFNKTLLEASVLQTTRKFSTSHMQRILRVTFLLKDVLHICEFNSSLLPSLMNHITALGGLAYYELETYFMFDEVRNEAFELLAVLLDLARLVRKNSESLERFFIFNLATVDAQFLAKQLSPAVMQTSYGTNEVNIAKLAGDILSSIMSLDLEEFDKGLRYDFTALLITHTRYLAKFCELKTRERISFIDPIFEHLSTIRQHIYFATNPLDAFLMFVPLHKMWNCSSRFVSFVRNPQIKVGNLPCLLELFTYYSFDKNVLRQLPVEIQKLSKRFNDTRGALFLRLQDGLSEKVGKNSPHVRIAQQSHSFSYANGGFNAKEFATPHGNIKRELVVSQTQTISAVVEIKKIFERMPTEVVLFKNVDQTAHYFASNLTSNLAKYLFKEVDSPEFPLLDMSFAAAAQFIWPLFSALGYSFQRRLFECRLVESSTAGSISFDKQIELLKGHAVSDDTPITRTLIVKIEKRFTDFLKTGARATMYIRPLRGFWNIVESEIDSSAFFTAESIHYMVSNLGIHSGVRIDRILTEQIAESITNIFNSFVETLPQLSSWYDEFCKNSTLKQDILQNVKLNAATQEMQVLGVALTLRAILRDEMKAIVDETIPGLSSLIQSALHRIKPSELKEGAILIREVFCGNTPDMPFVRARLQEKGIAKQDNSILFFFFFGIIFMNPQFTYAKYDAAHECITGNLHLFPTAIGGILSVSDILFNNLTDNTTRTNGVKVMFQVLATIIGSKALLAKKEETHSPPLAQCCRECCLALTVLSNMFPAAIPWVDYGTLESYFPTRSVNHAYSVAAENLAKNNLLLKK